MVTDKEFIEVWNRLKSASKVGKELKIAERSVHRRRKSIEFRHGISLEANKTSEQPIKTPIRKVDHKGRIEATIENGTVIVFSDAHYWPDLISTAHRALIKFIDHFKPSLIVCNGDAFDGGSISRFPRVGWDNKPTVIQELETVGERLSEIEKVAGSAKMVWTLGNHDARYETFLASRVPEFQGIDGFTLKQRFPRWLPAWSCWVNDNTGVVPTVIKHRWKGGIHATHNNTLNSGVNFVTGHLHSLKVTPFTDYIDTRFGVDTGTLAAPDGEQFMYDEDSPKNHRSGFAVLTFRNGQLLWPELVHVRNEDEGEIEFRGAVDYV